MNRKLIARLVAMNRKSDNTTNDQDVIVELTDRSGDVIELGFEDRNERVWLRLRLSDLVRAANEPRE